MSTTKLKNILHPICQRLWRVRTESGLTDAEIVRMSRKSHGWWHRLKHGVNTPFGSSIETISENLGVPIDWIKTGEGPEPNWKQFRTDMQLRSEMENKTYRNVINDMRRAGIKVPNGTASIISTDGTLPLLKDSDTMKALDVLALYVGLPRGQLLDKIDQIKAEQAAVKKKPEDAS